MSGLIRFVTFEDQPVLLATPAAPAPGAVDADAPSQRFAPDPAPDDTAAPARADDPAAVEPRFTYDEFMQQFEHELVKARAQAFEDAAEQGKSEGREQGAAEYAEQLASLAALIASARKSLDQGIDGVADIAVEIVYEAVAKIIGEHMTERDGVLAAVREVMHKAKERSRLVARVAPHDFEILNGDRSRLIEGLNVGEVEVVADERVRMGGCLLETPAGNLDGRLEIQLGQLRDVLLSARARQER